MNYSKKISALFLFSLIFSCKQEKKSIHPEYKSITESVYASGIVKSENQYQAFIMGTGTVVEIFVKEGDLVKKGQAILRLNNEIQKLTKNNAALQVEYANENSNKDKLNELKSAVDLSKQKYQLDSSIFYRQKELFEKNIGSEIDLQGKELNFKNSKYLYASARVKFSDFQRQLKLQLEQSKNVFLINSQSAGDLILKSDLDGRVYSINKKIGELVSPQIPIATIGDANSFYMELQVDEYDIVKIKIGQVVKVSMDSYKGKVFEGRIRKIIPIMIERSKSFLVEADFEKKPSLLFPNTSLEANIVLNKKEKSLIIPSNYLLNDSIVILKGGENRKVKLGLRDFRYTEVLEGLTVEDEIEGIAKK